MIEKYKFKYSYLDHMVEYSYGDENYPNKNNICEKIEEYKIYGVEFLILKNLTNPEKKNIKIPKSILEDYTEKIKCRPLKFDKEIN